MTWDQESCDESVIKCTTEALKPKGHRLMADSAQLDFIEQMFTHLYNFHHKLNKMILFYIPKIKKKSPHFFLQITASFQLLLG